MATLQLGKRDSVPAVLPEHGPELDRTAHFGEVCGMDGVRYVQGKALFNAIGKYVGPAPKEMCLAALTKEQERARQKQIQNNKKFFHAGAPTTRAAAVPQSIVDAERENARARAAESRAA
jgi:hypothetical protein